MKTTSINATHFNKTRIIPLGKARKHTRASNNESYPELAGDKTQRFGG